MFQVDELGQRHWGLWGLVWAGRSLVCDCVLAFRRSGKETSEPTKRFLHSCVCVWALGQNCFLQSTSSVSLSISIKIQSITMSLLAVLFFMASPQQMMCFRLSLSLKPFTPASINLLYGLLLLACSSIFSILLNIHWPFDVLAPVWPVQLCLHTVLSSSTPSDVLLPSRTRGHPQIHAGLLLSACHSSPTPSLLLNVVLYLFPQGCAISVGTLRNIIYPHGSPTLMPWS